MLDLCIAVALSTMEHPCHNKPGCYLQRQSAVSPPHHDETTTKYYGTNGRSTGAQELVLCFINSNEDPIAVTAETTKPFQSRFTSNGSANETPHDLRNAHHTLTMPHQPSTRMETKVHRSKQNEDRNKGI